jgi:hypothetical protein
MQHLRFEIRHADGRHESTSARAPRIVIGTGAHCDVRLGADQAHFEHVAIEHHPAGPLLRSLVTPATAAATVDGALLTARALGPSATLCIGGTQIHVTRVVTEAGAKSAGASVAAVAKLGVVAALVAAIAVVSRMSPEEPTALPPKAQELFAPTKAECPRTDPAEARVVAEDQRAIADGARERSPFDPREARTAIKGYEVAAACFRHAQLPDPAEEAKQNAARMRDETTLDFRTRRVRLERVLVTKDYDIAAQDVAVLRALTDGQRNDTTRWLSAVATDIKNHNAESAK